jgi:hypothetical protein
VHEVQDILASKSRRQLKKMLMSSNILPLFNTMNDTLTPPGRLPKPLETHSKRSAKKDDKEVTCCAL